MQRPGSWVQARYACTFKGYHPTLRLPEKAWGMFKVAGEEAVYKLRSLALLVAVVSTCL